MMDETVEHVSEISGMTKDQSIVLLKQFKWNKERLLEAFAEGEVDQYGLSKATFFNSEFLCEICFDDCTNGMSLECGHKFCLDCYKSYLESKISDGEIRFTCAGKCPLTIEDASVQKIVGETSFKKYQYMLLKNYVDYSPMKWCPAPGCEYIVECGVRQSQLDQIVPSVACLCGNRFCFGCLNQDHLPSI